MNKIFGIAAILMTAIFASGVLADNYQTTTYATVVCNDASTCPSGQTCVGSSCVAKVCGLDALSSYSGNYITFMNMIAGAGWVHSPDTIAVTNTGNILVTPEISGVNWVGNTYPGNGAAYMDVGQTAWTTTDWGSIRSLTVSPYPIATLTNGGDSTTAYFALSVPANQPTDTYTQAITFTAQC